MLCSASEAGMFWRSRGSQDGQLVGCIGLLSLVLFSVKNKVMGPGKGLSEERACLPRLETLVPSPTVQKANWVRWFILAVPVHRRTRIQGQAALHDMTLVGLSYCCGLMALVCVCA